MLKILTLNFTIIVGVMIMFDKDKFSLLLIKARGSRNNKQYSDNSGVSRAYVSGYINKSIDNAPTPEIIKKLAYSTEDTNVTYEKLMSAAGHISRPDILFKDNNGNILMMEAKSAHPSFTRKDEKDVEKLLNQTMDYIEEQEGLMLNGEILDENDLLLLKQAIKNGLEIAKISNKKRFTPKKYRKDKE
jgi:transcriptional regulator with XRE-family HTH domain